MLDNLSRKDYPSRAQFREFLNGWFINDIPNGPIKANISPDKFSREWCNIHGIITKDDRKPSRAQIQELVENLYPLLFESRTSTINRIYRTASLMETILEPRV
jgi:hypothetical protein